MNFEENWENRQNIEPQPENTEELERRDFYTCLIKIEDEKIIEKLNKVQKDISDFDCVNNVPEEYLHITVKLAGFMVENPTEDDEIQESGLEQVVSQARKIGRNTAPFEVKIRNINLFPTAIFAEIHENNRLKELNKEFQDIDECMDAPHDYIPHITISHFQNDQDFGELVEKLEEIREQNLGSLTVEEIYLVHDDLKESREKGFEIIEKIPLGE